MLTVGRRWPGSAPKGDYACLCDICGVRWRRSQLVEMADGLLYCPDDADGRDPVTLGKLEAANAKQAGTLKPKPNPEGGGSFDKGLT